MAQVYDNDKNHYSVKKQDAYKSDLSDAIHRAVWPCTDVDRFLSLLEKAGPEYLDVRHGSRYDTCLHRFDLSYFHEINKLIIASIIIKYYKNVVLLKFRACRFGKKKIVYLLLEKGAGVNEKNAAGSTPLHLASEYGDPDIVKVYKNTDYLWIDGF